MAQIVAGEIKVSELRLEDRDEALVVMRARTVSPQNQHSGLGAVKRLVGAVRDDTVLVNETERAATVVWPQVRCEMSGKVCPPSELERVT